MRLNRNNRPKSRIGGQALLNSPTSLAMFTAIGRASSRVIPQTRLVLTAEFHAQAGTKCGLCIATRRIQLLLSKPVGAVEVGAGEVGAD
jgi:hypothetical protein